DAARGISRRGLLGLAGAAAAGAVGGGGATWATTQALTQQSGSGAASVYPFYGEHQSGITTPAQDRLHFAAFDVNDITRDELAELLSDWTSAAARMTAGL